VTKHTLLMKCARILACVAHRTACVFADAASRPGSPLVFAMIINRHGIAQRVHRLQARRGWGTLLCGAAALQGAGPLQRGAAVGARAVCALFNAWLALALTAFVALLTWYSRTPSTSGRRTLSDTALIRAVLLDCSTASSSSSPPATPSRSSVRRPPAAGVRRRGAGRQRGRLHPARLLARHAPRIHNQVGRQRRLSFYQSCCAHFPLLWWRSLPRGAQRAAPLRCRRAFWWACWRAAQRLRRAPHWRRRLQRCSHHHADRAPHAARHRTPPGGPLRRRHRAVAARQQPRGGGGCARGSRVGLGCCRDAGAGMGRRAAGARAGLRSSWSAASARCARCCCR
jgi:hypothetical protein